jgi:hypothetical protein
MQKRQREEGPDPSQYEANPHLQHVRRWLAAEAAEEQSTARIKHRKDKESADQAAKEALAFAWSLQVAELLALEDRDTQPCAERVAFREATNTEQANLAELKCRAKANTLKYG